MFSQQKLDTEEQWVRLRWSQTLYVLVGPLLAFMSFRWHGWWWLTWLFLAMTVGSAVMAIKCWMLAFRHRRNK